MEMVVAGREGEGDIKGGDCGGSSGCHTHITHPSLGAFMGLIMAGGYRRRGGGEYRRQRGRGGEGSALAVRGAAIHPIHTSLGAK